MKKLYVLIDCPKANNDKSWIGALSVDGYNTILVDVPHKLSQLIRNGKLGRVKNYWLQIIQAWTTLRRSDKDDVIVVWYSVTGQIINLMSRWFGGRKLVLMNFLTPCKRPGVLGEMVKKTVFNPRNAIMVNTKKSEDQYRSLYGLKENDGARFFYFPDVYDDAIKFIPPKVYKSEEEKYFFVGGMSNRDWNLVAELAARIPETKFVCIALQSDFEQQVSIVPTNMEVHFNVPTNDYYDMMQNSYCVLLPLRSEVVSGLINLLKSVQLGTPCYISNTTATRQYYPKDLDYYLVEKDIDSWEKEIRKIMKYDQDKYESDVISLQKYIQDEYSPEKALARLSYIIKYI